MRKNTIINKIKRIINEFGQFDTDELEGDTYSPCVNSMGSLVALAEHIESDGVGVNVYDPTGFSSDAIESYNVSYEDLDKDILLEILLIAEQFEAEQLKTEKRCAN